MGTSAQLAGPGLGLPYPMALYPANLLNGENAPPTNIVTLSPGDTVVLPRGSWMVEFGGYAVLQWLDPITTIWRNLSSARTAVMQVQSDGFNYRVANLTGCAVGAIVTNGGSAYTSAPTITASSGGSTWLGVVGGRVNTTVSVTASGAGYGVPPLVFIPAPPAGGVPASAVAVMANGTISSITVLNQGAGYTTAPPISIYPSPYDPNFIAGSAITTAAATAALIGSGQLSAVLCTNSGNSFSAVPTLSISGGGGASAAATIVPMWTLTGASVTSGGAGYSAINELRSVGGTPTGTATYTNPAIELTGYVPRAASALMAQTGGTISSISVIYDGGLFVGTPNLLVLSLAAQTTPATIVPTLGSVNASVMITPCG